MKKLIIKKLLFLFIISITFTNCKNTEEPIPQAEPTLPELSTKVITEITSNSAAGGGVILKNDGSNIIESGICWSLEQNPTINDSITKLYVYIGEFKSNLRNLLPDTTYYVRAYSTNYEGTGYGNQVSFKSSPATIPTLQTNLLKIENTSIKIGGNFINKGGYPITSKGICWSESPNPTINDNKTEISSNDFSGVVENLTSGIKYYLKAYAINSLGVGYGNEIDITTSIVDYDGNEYHAITLGTQTWMIENLKTKKYQDGTSIPNVSNTTTWAELKTGAWCDFTNNATYGSKYGHLYNWYAVNNKLAPIGWHIPTNEEWMTLINYLGGLNIAGGKLKETGTTNWESPNTGATNESGFTALPAGWNYIFYFNLGRNGVWWSASDDKNNTGEAYSAWVFYNYENVSFETSSKEFGLSVRCIRDN